MEKYELQIIFAIAMFVTTAIAGFAPLKILKLLSSRSEANRHAGWVITLMSCYAGGVFLATSFLDILPHVSKTFERFNHNSSLNTQYPLAELIVCVGFFLVYLLEEIFSKIFVKDPVNLSNSSCKTKITKSSKEREVVKLNGNECNAIEREVAVTFENVTSATDPSKIARKHSLETAIGDSLGQDVLHSITFTLAMSFHSALEGIALGIQDSKLDIIMLFVSLMIHKGIEAYSVGAQIARCSAQRVKIVCVTIIVYSLMTPLGSLLGVFIQNAQFNELYKEGVIFVLEAIAVGTFIYVTFFEVLAEERSNEYSNLIQLIAIVAGFMTIAVFQYIELHIHVGSD